MRKLPKLVIFDWDGTLVDSIETIVLGFQRVYTSHGYPCPPLHEVRSTIGMPLASAFSYLSPGLPADDMVALYREYWFDPARAPSPWVPGALKVLDWLDEHRIPMAIATGKSRAGLEHELDNLAAQARFVSTRCAEDGPPKPHPEILHSLLKAHRVAPSEALLVGDSPLDLNMAGHAGVTAYGVLTGVGSTEQLASTGTPIIDSVADLLAQWQDVTPSV